MDATRPGAFVPQLPTLSADVLAMLTPALDIIAAQARHGVKLVEGKRTDRAAKVTARINGNNSSYTNGHAAIMAEVFGETLLRQIRASKVAVDPTCHTCTQVLTVDGCGCSRR